MLIITKTRFNLRSNYFSLERSKKGLSITISKRSTSTWKRLQQAALEIAYKSGLLRNTSPIHDLSTKVKSSSIKGKGNQKLIGSSLNKEKIDVINHKDYFFPLNITKYLKIKDFFFPIRIPDSKGLSGFIKIQQEWYIKQRDGTLNIHPEAKRFILIVYSKVLFTLGYHNVIDDHRLMKFSHDLLKACPHIFQTFKLKGISSRYMATLQHVLNAIFLKKKIPIELFGDLTKQKVDFNLYKNGNILLLIETLILIKNFDDLFDQISFTAVDHSYNFENTDTFNSSHSFELTGQQNCDWHATIGMIDNDHIEWDTFYHDSKMFESDIYKGRITLKPGLISNVHSFREYISKYQTSMQELIKRLTANNQSISEDHPIFELTEKVQNKAQAHFAEIRQMQVDFKGNFCKPYELRRVGDLLIEFNKMIKEGLLKPEIRSITNLGVSNDPGIDYDFCNFYYKNLETAFLSAEYLNKFNYEVLVSDTFYRLDHRNQINILLEAFPPEVALKIMKALNYIDHGS